jgi:hypothetical protein
MTYKEINWSEKDIGEIYEYLDNLPQHEKYPFIKWLYSNFPGLEFEWLDTFEDLRYGMTYKENIDACEEFIIWFPEQHPEIYSKRYEFIERDLCDYYLYIGNTDRLRQRVSYIAQYPVAGIDTITIRLYYQLLYHGLYKDAVQYARQVYQPIADDETLWGNPEASILNGLYVNVLQKAYQHFKDSGHADFSETIRFAAELGLVENEKIFQMESRVLQNPLDPIDILERAGKEPDDCVMELGIHFLKYMLEEHQVPFILSELLWSIVAVKDLFGKSENSEEFLYIDVIKFEEILDHRVDYSMGSNDLEMFGKIWALHYVYEFFKTNKLISAETAEKMHENNLYHRNEMIRYMGQELWQMSFVFNWPDHYLWAYLRPVFDSTFDASFEEKEHIIENFNQNHPIPQRIEYELEAEKKHQQKQIIYDEESTPFIKTTPDVGRNDPCPCGSGKKYKKCCLK